MNSSQYSRILTIADRCFFQNQRIEYSICNERKQLSRQSLKKTIRTHYKLETTTWIKIRINSQFKFLILSQRALWLFAKPRKREKKGKRSGKWSKIREIRKPLRSLKNGWWIKSTRQMNSSESDGTSSRHQSLKSTTSGISLWWQLLW